MPKRKVTTVVTLEVKLTVPFKQTPGHVLQFVAQTLGTAIDNIPANIPSKKPMGLQVQLVKKETTYA